MIEALIALEIYDNKLDEKRTHKRGTLAKKDLAEESNLKEI